MWIEHGDGLRADEIVENEVVILISDCEVVFEALCKFAAADFPAHGLVIVLIEDPIRNR